MKYSFICPMCNELRQFGGKGIILGVEAIKNLRCEKCFYTTRGWTTEKYLSKTWKMHKTYYGLN